MGRFGSGAESLAYAMVGRGFATVVASDAHSDIRRTPWMADVREMLARDFSPQIADTLLEENPRQILRDRELRMKTPHWF